ncbi:MAG: hypothetical protein RIN55_09045 [Tissierellaceae bacterium]|nr:hypothetical protein [Tissierellaceae bacterium]
MRILKKVLVVVVLALVISLILSNFVFDIKLTTMLEYAGIILIAIGAASVLGGRGITMDKKYQWTRANTNIDDISKKEIELLTDSYEFCIFMGISGLVLFIIALVIHYI